MVQLSHPYMTTGKTFVGKVMSLIIQSFVGKVMSLLSTNEVAQSCPTLYDPMDCRPPGSCVHGISQARILEWVAISFSRGSSWPRDWTCVSLALQANSYHWTTREAQLIHTTAWESAVSACFACIVDVRTLVHIFCLECSILLMLQEDILCFGVTVL